MRTDIIGREAELEALSRVVAAHAVVTVTGPPGVGKSALAARLAELRVGSIVCSLTTAESEGAICREVAAALALPLPLLATDAASIERIGRALARRGKVLVLLDDVDPGRATVARLVPRWAREAPLARFVVTSRARLPVAAAQRFEVGPLATPELVEQDASAVTRVASVRLFVRAAQAAAPSYVLRRGAISAVAEIARRLEGLPLAIELCASRVVILGVGEILELLTRSLDMIEGGPGALRGRSLRGAFTLSWERLDREDARVLAACAALRGSFDLEAATAVSAADGGSAARVATAAALERLEEASLVRAYEPEALPGARRYVLPATLRAFVAAKWQERPEAEEVGRRHALHFASLAQRRPSPSLDALALVRDDLEQALSWSSRAVGASATPRAARELAARLLLAMAPLVLARGPLAPFLARVDELLDAKDVPRALAAELYLSRAMARIFHGRRDDALVDLACARRRATAAKDRRVSVLATSKRPAVDQYISRC